MTQYLLTSIRYWMEAYETIGGLFKDMKQDYIENIRILAVVSLILNVLEKLVESIDIE